MTIKTREERGEEERRELGAKIYIEFKLIEIIQ